MATRAIRALGVADACAVVLATGIAGLIGKSFSSNDGLPLVGLGAVVTPPFVILVWLASLSLYRTHDPLIVLTGVEYYRRAITGTLVAFGVVGIVGFIIDLRAARPYMLFGLPVGLVLVIAVRWVVRQRLLRARSRGAAGVQAVIVIDETPTQDLGPIGEFIDVVAETHDHEPTAIAALALQVGAQAVVVRSSRFVESHWIQQLTWELDAHGLNLLIDAASAISMAPRMTVIPMRARTLLAIDPLQLTGGSTPLKRGLDILGALLGMLVLAPVFAVALLAVRIADGTPVLFTQTRVGHGGAPFRIRKIRTMVPEAEATLDAIADGNEASGGLFKIKDDPRITAVGRVIRRWSIDELPQLWNVLVGDMSLVGPRPRLPQEHEVDHYGQSRTRVRPGLTGLWQVSGRSDLSDEETQTLDLMYIDSWSFVGDLVILARTVKAILTGKGAY